MGVRDIGRRLMNVSAASILRWLRGKSRRAAPPSLIDRIPVLGLHELIQGRPIIRVNGSYNQFDGSLPWCDIVPLLSILVTRSPRSVLEVGTFNGHTTRLIALNLPEATIHTIDLPEVFEGGFEKDDYHLISTRKVGIEYLSDPSITNVKQHFGDTASWDFSQASASFFFIDGSHTYAYVRNDTERALASAAGRRATLIWHDCDGGHPDVTRWLAEMIQAGQPVKRIAESNLAILET